MNNEKEKTDYNPTVYIKVQSLPVPCASTGGKKTVQANKYISGSALDLSLAS